MRSCASHHSAQSLIRHDGATISVHRQALMNKTATLERSSAAPASAREAVRAGDDKAMLKAAANLTRDLNSPSAVIYWADLLGSALIGYAGLAATMLAPSAPLAGLAGLIAVLALYRAGSFIHELTHLKPRAVPG